MKCGSKERWHQLGWSIRAAINIYVRSTSFILSQQCRGRRKKMPVTMGADSIGIYTK